MIAVKNTRLQLESLEARDVPAYLGELDPTFGTGGVLKTPSPITTPGFPAAVVDSTGQTIVLSTSAAAVDGSGDIVALGSTAGGTAEPSTLEIPTVSRFTPTGALDTTFGNGGTVQFTIPDGYLSFGNTSLAIDAAGNVVIAGEVRTSELALPNLAILRLTPSGAFDPTFNGGQVEVIDVADTGAYLEAITLDATGRILLAGQSGVWGEFVVRLNPDGEIDTTFGNAGFVTTTDSGPATAIATDPAGNVYVGGPLNGIVSITKLTAKGTPDPTFGTAGVFQDPLPTAYTGPYIAIRGLAITATGNLLAAVGVGISEDVQHLAVLDLNPDGTLDPSFNAGGPLPGTNTIDFGDSYDQLSGMSLTPTGDILLSGFGSIPEIAKLIGTGPGRPVGGGGTGTTGGSGGSTGSQGNGNGGSATPTPVTPQNPFASLGVGVRTAIGDVNGDGTPDTIYVTGPGTPLRVEVISGTDGSTVIVPAFDPFGDNFTGGAWVVAADFNHSGRDQIVIAADVGGGPQIVIWSLLPDGQMQEDASFYGITDPNFRGGTRIAVGDVNDDGTPDLVVAAGYGGGPRVAVFDGTTLLSGNPTKLVNDFYVFQSSSETSLRNGLYVAVGDVNGDGYADLIFGAGIGGGPRVLVLSGKILIQDGAAAALAAPLANFFVGGSDSSRSGVAVAVTTDANDGVADIVAGLPAGTISVPLVGQKGTMVPVYAGSTLTPDTQPTPAMSINPTTDPVLSGVFVE